MNRYAEDAVFLEEPPQPFDRFQAGHVGWWATLDEDENYVYAIAL
jgi:hypothetical protein